MGVLSSLVIGNGLAALNIVIGLSLEVLSFLLRVVLQSTKNEESASEHADKRFNAIIVEAVEQDLLGRKVVPNKSMEYLNQLMQSVPADSNRMIVAPISDVGLVRHAGLAVFTSSSVSQKASCVLSLIAHTGRSVISDLVGGHKLVSKHCWNVPFVSHRRRCSRARK